MGKFLLNTGGLALDEDFSFIFNNGSMNFTIGFNSNYGEVSNKSGTYANFNSIKYYFEYDDIKNLWKITFNFE